MCILEKAIHVMHASVAAGIADPGPSTTPGRASPHPRGRRPRLQRRCRRDRRSRPFLPRRPAAHLSTPGVGDPGYRRGVITSFLVQIRNLCYIDFPLFENLSLSIQSQANSICEEKQRNENGHKASKLIENREIADFGSAISMGCERQNETKNFAYEAFRFVCEILKGDSDAFPVAPPYPASPSTEPAIWISLLTVLAM